MQKVFKPFNFAKMNTTEEFSKIMSDAGVPFPVSKNLDILKAPIMINGKEVPNRMCIHPVEGFDGTEDGKPSDLIFRRYERYAKGGAGLLWYESIAISEDGRCNPQQMKISEENLSEIKRLVDETNAHAIAAFGRKPYNVIQLTHSGRRSNNKKWESTPLVVVRNPYIDHHCSIDGSAGNITMATDEKIEEIVQGFIDGAVLSMEAGFDSVDVKICHEYILRELLAAFERPGKYGGSFENRTRAIFDIINGIKEKCGNGIDICVRLNAYDCIPYPHGWGMRKEDGVMAPDLTETIQLCRLLVEQGVELINISTMMPRYQPYGRGYLAELEGSEINPYKGTYNLLEATHEIKKAVPGGKFVATGLTWLEQFGCAVGAGGIEQEWFDFAGFGRQAFAYPDFAKDVIKDGTMYRGKCCITCDKCYDLIQKGHCETGCVIRDSEVYLPLYKSYVMGSKKI